MQRCTQPVRRVSVALLWSSLIFGALDARAEVDTSLLVTPLIAGQTINIGTLRCGVDPAQPDLGACVGQVSGGWCLSLAHLYVGLEPPSTMAPGQFPFRQSANGCVTQIRVDFRLPTVCRGQPYTVAFHAEASRAGQNETAWGQGSPTGRNWSMTTGFSCRPVDT